MRPTLVGLAIEPLLPEQFTDLPVTRVFRGVTYRIAMQRTGERTGRVNGEQLAGNVVPVPTDDTKLVKVAVTF